MIEDDKPPKEDKGVLGAAYFSKSDSLEEDWWPVEVEVFEDLWRFEEEEVEFPVPAPSWLDENLEDFLLVEVFEWKWSEPVESIVGSESNCLSLPLPFSGEELMAKDDDSSWLWFSAWNSIDRSDSCFWVAKAAANAAAAALPAGGGFREIDLEGELREEEEDPFAALDREVALLQLAVMDRFIG